MNYRATESVKRVAGKLLRAMVRAVVLVLFLLTFAECDKSITLDDLPRLEFSVENVGATQVWLRVTFDNLQTPIDFSVERDGRQVISGKLFRTDTVVIDHTALPKRSYQYRAAQVMGSTKKLQSGELTVTTLDTTSHSIVWQVDTLGVRGTIYDVWAFSSTNIWAVGEIYVKNEQGQEDPILRNLAQWDGQQWTVSKVVGPTVRAIYAFSPTDVWIGTSAPYHYDGQQWQVSVYPGEGFYIEKIWGTSSSNLFIVGTNGSIAHYNGSAWQRMESGTTVDLEDIWGIDGNNIWATGTSTSAGRSVLLYFNGGSWTTIYDTFNQPPATQFGLSSIWADNNKILYVAGSSGVRRFTTAEKTFQKEQTPQVYGSYQIRATGNNDILVGGAGGELLHYNGSSWYVYPELKLSGGSGFAFWYSVTRTSGVDVVGGEIFTGLYGVPVVIRGSR